MNDSIIRVAGSDVRAIIRNTFCRQDNGDAIERDEILKLLSVNRRRLIDSIRKPRLGIGFLLVGEDQGKRLKFLESVLGI